MRIGISDHFGWAVAVTASADHEVVDRRRIELVEPGVTAAPIHYDSARLDVAGTAALVAELAGARGWSVQFYDAKRVVDEAVGMLGERAGEVLDGPRARLGPPWTKDHRMALAATIVGG